MQDNPTTYIKQIGHNAAINITNPNALCTTILALIVVILVTRILDVYVITNVYIVAGGFLIGVFTREYLVNGNNPTNNPMNTTMRTTKPSFNVNTEYVKPSLNVNTEYVKPSFNVNTEYVKPSFDVCVYQWFTENYVLSESHGVYSKVKDIYALFKSGEYFRNLTKIEKRKYNYKYFAEHMKNSILTRNYFSINASSVMILKCWQPK